MLDFALLPKYNLGTGKSTLERKEKEINVDIHAIFEKQEKYMLTYPDCEIACARDIEEIILKTSSGRIAAFIAEPIAGVSGLITPPPEYFELAVGVARKYGGLFIADEVQTMFGRDG